MTTRSAAHPRLPLQLPIDKRWKGGEERWRTPGEVFDPRAFGVDVIPEREAKQFVIAEHYSHAFPAARLSVGLFRCAPAHKELVGVAVFAVPMNGNTIPRYTLLPAQEGVELSRLVLRDDVAYNGESWFVTRAFAALRAHKTDVRAVISYADPLERRDPITGDLQKRAHYGVVYQALSAFFGGRATARHLLVAPDGTIISERALSKIRTGERGCDYATRQLVAAGAPARAPHEDPREWLERAIAAPGFRKIWHPGNFCYVFAWEKAVRARLATHLSGPACYPRKAAA